MKKPHIGKLHKGQKFSCTTVNMTGVWYSAATKITCCSIHRSWHKDT